MILATYFKSVSLAVRCSIYSEMTCVNTHIKHSFRIDKTRDRDLQTDTKADDFKQLCGHAKSYFVSTDKFATNASQDLYTA